MADAAKRDIVTSPATIGAAATNGAESEEFLDPYDMEVNRKYEWSESVFISFSLSLCITVDILQYSMPLAFLPSVLEDRGHSPMKIATAIGVYYWTGFAGGCCITGYQIYRVLSGEGSKSAEDEVITVNTARRQIRYLNYGLLIGCATLLCQANSPRYNVHTACRFIQGFAGAFLFFYTFLLSAQLFDGPSGQRTFAMTSASTALNVAEVLGSFAGAIVFHFYGQRMVFVVLAVASMLNIGILMMAYYMLRPADPLDDSATPEQTAQRSSRNSRSSGSQDGDMQDGWVRLKALLRGPRLLVAVLLIVTAAIVKGSIEEMLPFHADHRWHADPLQIGMLFSMIAVAYILAAVITGRMWESMGCLRVPFAAFWLGCLGIVAYGGFSVASWPGPNDEDRSYFHGFLVLYGICLGTTHTPAALILSDAIEHEKGPGKDAANGIWNTMWEAGGSIGFLLGGLLAHNYAGQLELLSVYSVMCVISAAVVMAIGHGIYDDPLCKRESILDKDDYGSVEKSEKEKRSCCC